MKELAEALKQRAGLRMRQGVVMAVTEPTVSVLIGGSSVAVDGVQHLNSCSPQTGDVVWIASDGADLWIIGTHGAWRGKPVISVKKTTTGVTCTDTDLDYEVPWPAPDTDPWGMWNASEPTLLILPAAGLWLLSATVEWMSNASAGYVTARFENQAFDTVLESTIWAQANYVTAQSLSGVVRLTANDRVKLILSQGKGSGQQTYGGSGLIASAVWLGD